MKLLPTKIDPKPILKKIPGVISGYVLEHKGAVLTGGVIACNTAGIALTYKNSPKIHSIISEAREALSDPNLTEDVRVKIRRETIKELVPLVTPIFIFYAGSVTCAVVNQKQNEAKIATLTAGLTLAQNTIAEYDLFKEETRKEVGEEKYREIQQEVADRSIEETYTRYLPEARPGEKLFYLTNLGLFFSAEGEEHVKEIMKKIEGIITRNGVAGESYGNMTHRGNEIVTYANICEELRIPDENIPAIADELYFEGGRPFRWATGVSPTKRDKYGNAIFLLTIVDSPTNLV